MVFPLRRRNNLDFSLWRLVDVKDVAESHINHDQPPTHEIPEPSPDEENHPFPAEIVPAAPNTEELAVPDDPHLTIQEPQAFQEPALPEITQIEDDESV